MPVCSDTTWLPVGDETLLTVTITVDYQQAKTIMMRLGSTIISPPNNTYSNVPIQAPYGETLRNKILNCRILVQDIQIGTNKTAVDIILRMGGKTIPFRYAMEALTNGMVDYDITFFLVHS